LLCGAFSRLYQRDAIITVSGRLIETSDLSSKPRADCKAGDIIDRNINALPRGELLHNGLKTPGIACYRKLGV
jgi:hypothetical protein